jgi:serine/threonine protein kinase
MGLAPGSRLGPYEIVALLGAGGMGEVYRGRDTRLLRTVAIKILPPRLAPRQIHVVLDWSEELKRRSVAASEK